MKTILNRFSKSVFTLLFLLVSLAPGFVIVKPVAAFSGGSGTSGDPYLITTAAELASLSSYLGSGNSSKYFKVMNNIDLNVSPYNSGAGWTPIGNSSSNFYGKFDGNGKTISNLYINNSGGTYMGLFGVVASAGLVENVVLSNITITSYRYAGGLIGSNVGTVEDSGVTGGTIAGGMRTGGLVGSNSGTMRRTYANVAVTFNESVTTCCSGGLVGEVAFGGASATIYDSYSRSSLYIATGSNNQGSHGGLLGNDYNSGSKYNLYSTGAVTSSGSFPSNVGGLSGGQYTSITSSYWDTQTSGWATSNGGAGVAGKTTAQMKDQATYSGWDFTNVWAISPGVNDGYPYLRWQQVNTSPDIPSSLGGSSYVNGSFGNDNTPTLSFSLSDSNGSDTVKFRVQIDDSSDFSSPVVDYTSALVAQGSASFTVGQAVGGGSYVTGSSGQTLSDGSYYWRVRAIDNSLAESNYATANSGVIAFKIDATAPSSPGSPSATSGSTNNTPTWSWTASSDNSSGLATTAYTVQWSQSSGFSSGVSASTSSTSSFTHSSTLADGTWYFRVLATDTVGNNSSFSSNGSILIDTTAPSAPGTPATTSTTNDNTPNITWTSSSDTTSGLGTPAYTLEWSLSSIFSSGVSSTTTTSNEYTATASLINGTWYFRVKAHDAVGNTSGYSTVGSITISTSVSSVRLTSAQNINSNSSLIDEELSTDPGQAIIALNDFDKFYTEGISLPLTTKQIVYFCATGTGQMEGCGLTNKHSVTVHDVDHANGTVTIIIASDPITAQLKLNEEKEFDVDNDGYNNIAIKLVGFDNNGAQLVFRRLSKSISATNQDTKIVSPKINQTASLSVLGLAIIMSLTLYVAKRRNKQH